MDFFRRKSDRPHESSGNSGAPSQAGSSASITHRLTRELERAESLARMLAASRAAAVVEVADYLAGIYIYDWERLSKFWEDQDEIQSFLQRICRISPQRWHRWIEFYDKERREGARRDAGRFFGAVKDPAREGDALAWSGELESILRKAEAIAPHHDNFEGRSIPILTSECVLLCIAQSEDSETGRKLRETGLDVASLEHSARNPKHAPLHGTNNE